MVKGYALGQAIEEANLEETLVAQVVWYSSRLEAFQTLLESLICVAGHKDSQQGNIDVVELLMSATDFAR